MTFTIKTLSIMAKCCYAGVIYTELSVTNKAYMLSVVVPTRAYNKLVRFNVFFLLSNSLALYKKDLALTMTE